MKETANVVLCISRKGKRQETAEIQNLAEKPNLRILRLWLNLLCFAVSVCASEPVWVSLTLDKWEVRPGETTTLKAWAEIAPEHLPRADQILSWSVDLLNEDVTVARLNPQGLLKPTSDLSPTNSSSGLFRNGQLLGIFDSFRNLPGAGRDDTVLLFSIPVTGLAVGEATFSLGPGTGSTNGIPDFIVTASEGNDPLFGADFSFSSVILRVATADAPLKVDTTQERLPNGQLRLRLTFQPQAGRVYDVQTTGSLVSQGWALAAGGANNNGLFITTNSAPRAFYRVVQRPP